MRIAVTPAAREVSDDLMATKQVHVRRSLALVLHWESGYLATHNFVSGKVARISPDLVPLLAELKSYASLDDLAGDSVSGISILRRLIRHDILVKRGSSLALKEEALFSEWQWDISAKHFHFATNSVNFEWRNETVLRALELKKKSEPPPSPFHELGHKYVSLPLPSPLEMNLNDALKQRRTCRGFLQTPVELAQLSTLLATTWGVTAISAPGRELGEFILKTSPSGGARHPTEVYIFSSRVRGLEPGIYHYSPRLHALCKIRRGNPSKLAGKLCACQPWVSEAAVVFFMTAMVSRTMWKYGHSHAYRVLLLDAGHLGQTFHLACTALGLGPFTTAAINGFDVEEALGLDGIKEIVMYAAATGLPRLPNDTKT
jgi:SagB-type dehydrogenase family enzyme